jgi:hypothetical protein
VIGRLFDLLFREIFEFGRVQTDPNFANYLYDTRSGRLGLLDFGATRLYSAHLADAYRRLLVAGRRSDRPALDEPAMALGYFQADIADRHRQQVLDIFLLACEPLRHPGAYDFGQSDLARRIHAIGLQLALDKTFWHTPPADVLFLHRKIGGLYLLAARLGARVDIGRLFLRHAPAAS